MKVRRQRRHGYVLVLFAMLLGVIFGMAALVIDLGLARYEFRKMQSETDRDALDSPWSEYDLGTEIPEIRVIKRREDTEDLATEPPLPWYFARVPLSTSSEHSDLLESGITFQVDSRAQARPVMMIGAPTGLKDDDEHWIEVGYACDHNSWLASDMPQNVQSVVTSGMLSVGDEVATTAIDGPPTGYVAIFEDSIESGRKLIVGFGKVVEGHRQDGYFVPRNASATWFPPSDVLDKAIADDLLVIRDQLHESGVVVLTPTLASSLPIPTSSE
ncbi:Tad domain-containing protein [Bremerella sp. JC770]|uniref:Tad domain-containing protein n=1 Tax=Bremerella sp. JC770 TaxID=3232137 RepID=UPI00345A5937